MEATHLKEVETGATKKADIVSGIKEKLLEEDFAGNYSNWQEVSVMTGYKKSVLENLSEGMTGRATTRSLWARFAMQCTIAR